MPADAELPKSIPPRRWCLAALLLLGAGLAVWWSWTRLTRPELEASIARAVALQDWPQAERALTQLRRLAPDDPEVLDLLAQVTLRRGRRGDHLHWLEVAADTAEQPVNRYLTIAAQAVELGRPRDAERLYRKAIQRAPDRLEPYSGLARLYLAWRRGTALREVIAEVETQKLPLVEDPTLLWLWVVGDRVTWLDDEAQSWLELVQREQPDDPHAPAALVEQLVQQGRIAKARELLRSVSSFADNPAERLRSAAIIELAAGRFAAAASLLDQHVDAAAQSADDWLLRGESAQGLGDLEGAGRAYAQAVLIDPWQVDAMYHFGRVLGQQGQMQKSTEVLQRAVRTDDVVRRCLQLLQAAGAANPADLAAVAELALDLDQQRWAQLVAALAERRSGGGELSAGRLAGLRGRALPPLRVTVPASPPLTAATIRESVQGALPAVAPAAADRHVAWVDATGELGVSFVYEYGHTPERWLMETLGGGVAALDYDGDGWTDLFFAQGGDPAVSGEQSRARGKLWRNRGGSAFEDQTEDATLQAPGYSHGCAAGDVNQDGFVDLLVCRYGGLSWHINRGDGTWQNETLVAGVESSRWNTSAAFADFDGDGDLDVYVAGYCRAPFSADLRQCQDSGRPAPCRPNAYAPEQDSFWENLGDGRFADRSREILQSDDVGYGLGVVAADFDGDRSPEVFVGNDTTVNSLWSRRPGSTSPLAMEDRGLISGVGVDGTGRAEACMGIACGDYDGDEQFDLFVTNFHDETCTLYRNLGGLQFEDETDRAGLSNAGRRLMGWGCQFADADNDGWLDLMLVNGYLHDVAQRPQFYRNAGGRFLELSDRAGAYFQRSVLGRSVATWDFNRDGQTDLVVSHQLEPAVILRNVSQADRSVTLLLSGTKGPRDATGAVVRARAGTHTLVRLVSSQGGYLSACAPEVLIGLGESDGIDELVVDWPGGHRESFGAIPGATRQLIREGAGAPVSLEPQVRGE